MKKIFELFKKLFKKLFNRKRKKLFNRKRKARTKKEKIKKTKKVDFYKQTTPLLIVLLGVIILICGAIDGLQYFGFVSIPLIIGGVFWYDHNEKANEWQYLKLIKRYNSLKNDFDSLECITRSTVEKCSSRIDEIDKYKKQNIKGQIIYKKGSADKE
ncbi:MAG: hypothetical protein KBS62_00330 [Oscillospiraceae bacterium]|nr:hypothetical protein [Candidatus Ruminococcus equi]